MGPRVWKRSQYCIYIFCIRKIINLNYFCYCLSKNNYTIIVWENKWIYFCKMISFFKNKNQRLKFFLKALKIYSKNEHNHHRKINVFSKNFEVKASRIVESHSIRPMISHISFVLFIPTTLNHFCSHFILFFLLPYNKIFFNP